MPLTGPGTNSFPGNGVIIIDETPIVGGTDGYVLYDNNGVVGVEAGGGGGTITEGTTPTSGFTDGYAITSSGGFVGQAQIRTILTGNLNLYVNASTGSDSYNGLSATFTGGVNGPWATLQRFLTYCSEIDGGGWAAIGNLAAGTYEGGFYANTVGLSAIQIYGAGSTSTIITNAGADGCLVTDVPLGAVIAFNGVGLIDSTGFDCFTIQAIAIDAYVGDFLTFGPTDVAFTTVGGNCISVEDISTVFNIDGTITINQSGVSQSSAWLAESGGVINQSCSNIVLSGSANTYTAFASATGSGRIIENGAYSGSAIGPRFSATLDAAIYSAAAGELGLNFYPGTEPGLCDPTSSYDGSPGGPTINVQTASYQLASIDAGNVVEMNAAGANNLTIPTNATVQFPVNTRIDVVQIGAGQTTFVAAGGVTLHSAGGAVNIAAQYGGATIYQRAIDEWVLIGEIA